MQQRVIIAAALILHPALVIADEPTTALDVTVQMQILALLKRLQASEANTSIILIRHDLGVVAQMCERAASCTPAPSSRRARPRRCWRTRGIPTPWA